MKLRHLRAKNHVTTNPLKLADELLEGADVTPQVIQLAMAYALLGIGEALQELASQGETRLPR